MSLKTLRPALSTLKPRLLAGVATVRDDHGHSLDLEPLRRLYSTARWRRLRLKIIARDANTCQMPTCGVVRPPSGLVCDHVKPHRGDLALFWNEENLQTLCKPCHDNAKQRDEASARRLGG